MPAQIYSELKSRVENGATLYISNDDGILSDFNRLAGVTVNDSETKYNSGCFKLNGKNVNYGRLRNYIITAENAEVLAIDENGMPIFTKNRYGKGTVYYLNFPIEKNLIDVCDGFENSQNEVYSEIFKAAKNNRPLVCENKYIGITRHIKDNLQWFTMINYSSMEQKTNIQIKSNFKYEVLKGNIEKIAPFEMTILKIEE